MDWLRADALASHNFPYNVRTVLTITGTGAYGYSMRDDIYTSDSLLKGQFKEHSTKAFYSFNHMKNEQNRYHKLHIQR